MDYGALLKDSWRITWRHKYLWILGLLAGEAGGCNISFGTGDFDTTTYEGQLSDLGFDGLDQWLSTYWVLIAVVVLAALVLALVFVVLSIIAKAGLIVGVDDIALRRPDAGLGRAWRGGVRRFGRLLGMYLLVGVAVAAVVIVAGAIVAIPVVSWVTTGAEPGLAGVLILVLIVLVLVVAAIPAGVALQMVVTWGTRALVLDDTGVTGSLRTGWRLLRSRLGASLLLYLLSLAVAAGVGLAVGLVLIVIGMPVVLAVIASDGLSALTWAGIALGGAAMLALSLVASAIAGTFFGTYWTLAYRRLFPPPAADAAFAAVPSGDSRPPAWQDLGGRPPLPPAR